MAASRGHLRLVSLLVECRADKDQAAEGITPLFAAAFAGRFDVARFLVQQGADRNQRPGRHVNLQSLWHEV